MLADASSGMVQLGVPPTHVMAARKTGEPANRMPADGSSGSKGRRRRPRRKAKKSTAAPLVPAAVAVADFAEAPRLSNKDSWKLLRMLTCWHCGLPRCFDTPEALMQHCMAVHGMELCDDLWR
jgi:hypothetical protein